MSRCFTLDRRKAARVHPSEGLASHRISTGYHQNIDADETVKGPKQDRCKSATLQKKSIEAMWIWPNSVEHCPRFATTLG